MSTLLVSSKGQIVLPAALRRRLGMGAGATLELLEELDGLKLRVVRFVATTDLTGMVGMVKAKARGVPRRLEDFDPASLLAHSRPGKPLGRSTLTSSPASSSTIPTMRKLPNSSRLRLPPCPKGLSCQ